MRRHMAKSDSFYIRAEVDTANDGSTYTQTEIDLGSFVNLGVAKSTLLRIHNVAVSYKDSARAVSENVESARRNNRLVLARIDNSSLTLRA